MRGVSGWRAERREAHLRCYRRELRSYRLEIVVGGEGTHAGRPMQTPVMFLAHWLWWKEELRSSSKPKTDSAPSVGWQGQRRSASMARGLHRDWGLAHIVFRWPRVFCPVSI